MGVGEVILAVILFFCFAPFALVVWGEAISEWNDLNRPPKPHDPARYFTRRRWSWESGPESMYDWLAGGPLPEKRKPRVPVQVAEIMAVLDGDTTDTDSGTISARIRVRLPDGNLTTLHRDMSDSVNVRAGAFLPVRPVDSGMIDVLGDTWNPAWELTSEEIGRVLLDHQHRLELVDADAYRVLGTQLSGHPVEATVEAIRPTGTVRHGHVEVDLDAAVDGEEQTVRGFLRPEDIATARHTRLAQVTRAERDGWVLWPTWY